MKLLDLTLSTAAANIALDEALLEAAEIGIHNEEILRLWQPTEPIVVLGRSSSVDLEVNLKACKSDGIQIIRRCSGGATILTAPGCLMYAALLSYNARPQLRMLDDAHQFVIGKTQAAIRDRGIDAQFQGTCDLTVDSKKVSGNALRCKKNWLIYHGTLICKKMDLSLISKYLGKPKREPEYRAGRSHREFLTKMTVECDTLALALIKSWRCNEVLQSVPQQLTDKLVREKYTNAKWNYKI